MSVGVQNERVICEFSQWVGVVGFTDTSLTPTSEKRFEIQMTRVEVAVGVVLNATFSQSLIAVD